VKREDLEKERKASLERRKKQLESGRRERPASTWTDMKGLSRAQKLKLRNDDFVPPSD
jgi:hypothetical protein